MSATLDKASSRTYLPKLPAGRSVASHGVDRAMVGHLIEKSSRIIASEHSPPNSILERILPEDDRQVIFSQRVIPWSALYSASVRGNASRDSLSLLYFAYSCESLQRCLQ
jgi:hypothetical protein